MTERSPAGAVSRWAVFDLNGTLIDSAGVCPISRSVLSPLHCVYRLEANLL